MRIALVRWRDACSEEASSSSSADTRPRLVELQEVGFFLAEDEHAVTIGMEMDLEGTVEPGRWRLHIPKANIVEMSIMDIDLMKKGGTPIVKPKRTKKRLVKSATWVRERKDRRGR